MAKAELEGEFCELRPGEMNLIRESCMLPSRDGEAEVPTQDKGLVFWIQSRGLNDLDRDALLAISVLSTGLFTGLLMTVVFFFEKALRELSGSQFAHP